MIPPPMKPGEQTARCSLKPEKAKSPLHSSQAARGKGKGGSERWPKKLDQGGERGFEAAKPKKGATQLCAKSSVQSPRYSRLQMFRWRRQSTCYHCSLRTNTGCGGRALEILGRPDKSCRPMPSFLHFARVHKFAPCGV